MTKITRCFLSIFVLATIFSFSGLILAQEVVSDNELITAPASVSEEVIEAVSLDEDVEPEDLEIGEPRVLPDSPFYFLKNWGRGIQELFTLNTIAKAKLRARFANEMLMELKRMIQAERDPEEIREAIENYQREMERIRERAEKIKEKAQENPEIEEFLDKFVKHQLLHQRLLEKLENQVPSEVLEKIRQARERHLEKFAEVMTKLEDRGEKIRERLEEQMEGIEGSKYKNFKNLEVLLELEDKVPEQAKEAIRKAQENALRRLQGDLENMSLQDQERFKDYLEKIGGLKERQLEILESLRSELEEIPELKEQIFQIRERLLERIREGNQELNCPEVEKPVSGFCQEGRIVAKRDNAGCIISFECVIPAEVEIPPGIEVPPPGEEEVCITLWDPVCGANGKTYSNACFARLAGVMIAYNGKCQEKECETDADCPQPRCGPTGTISVRCIGLKAKCIGGICQIVPMGIEAPPPGKED